MNDKLKKMIFIIVGAFVALFLFFIILSSCSSKKKYSPGDLEGFIIDKVKSYYSNRSDELPGENSVLSLSLENLSSKGIINNISSLVEDGVNCSGNVIIENNNNYYMYSPKISCTTNNGTYDTNNLREALLKNVVTSGSGLYSYNGEYYFRGDSVNNYIVFDGLLWQIVKINKDNSLKLILVNRVSSVIWDNRYNSENESPNGINDLIHNNIPSRMKEYLDLVYKENFIFSNDAKGYLKAFDLCIGKRGLLDDSKDGSTECSETLNNQYIGLLQLNEYLIPSLDQNCLGISSVPCLNYNYLANMNSSFWTITANKDNSSEVFIIYGLPQLANANNSNEPKIVVNISENTNVSGTGSYNDPYVVSGMSSEIRTLD